MVSGVGCLRVLACHVYMLFSETSLCFVLISNCIVSFLLLGFQNSFHILDTDPLSRAGFASASAPSVAQLSILFTWTSTEQKFLILMRSSVPSLPFMAVLLVSSLRTRCLTLDPEDFLLCLFIKVL